MSTDPAHIDALEELARHFEMIAEIGAKPGIHVTQSELNTVGGWAVINAMRNPYVPWGQNAAAVAEYIRRYIKEKKS